MGDPIRIGMAVDSFFPIVDGVTEVVDHYAREFAASGAEVTVFAPAQPGRPYDDSVFPYKVTRCKAMRLPFIDYSLPTPGFDRSFRDAIREAELDILHIHSPATIGHLAMKEAKRRGIPVVCTLHSQIRRDIQRAVKSRRLAQAITRKVLRYYDEAEWWTMNRAVAKIAHESYGLLRLPRIVPNATEMTPVADAESARREIEENFGIGAEEMILLYVGRLNKLKNILLIADSLGELKTRTDRPFRMLFVGAGQDEKELRARIRENGVEEETVFAGEIRDREKLARVYAAADLLLFPSYYDTSSLVQIEAAVQATPGLFARGSATADTITEGVNGFLSKGEAGIYAQKIAEILADQKTLREVGEHARRDLVVTWKETAARALARYRELIEKAADGA